MKITTSNILLAFLTGLILLVGIVSANSDYCTPSPNVLDTIVDHNGDWWNITIYSTDCYICIDTGGGMGDVSCSPCSEYSPSTSFSTNKRCEKIPATFQFTDTTLATGITGYYWMFGDGNTSTLQNPSNVYVSEGIYPINHSVTNSFGTSWENKSEYLRAIPKWAECESGSVSVYGNEIPVPLPIVLLSLIVAFVIIGVRRK